MAMATFIDNARRQSEKGLRRRSGGDRYRIYYHIFSAVCLLFVAQESARLFILASSILLEIGIHFWTPCGRFVMLRPKSFHLLWIGLQLLVMFIIQRAFRPKLFSIPGVVDSPLGFPAGTSGDPRVMVGPNGVVAMPYDIDVSSTIANAAKSAISGGTPYLTGDDFSVIIVVRNEDKYISKTVVYTFQETPAKNLKEIIVVDDNSDNPVSKVLDKELPEHIRRIVRVVRLDTKEGLIRARIVGANMAEAANILFLDGHCKPKPNWIQPLLVHLKANYKRLACPVIQDINESSWEDVGTFGTKMMFEWNFEFGWYDDLTDEVPISAGGIFAMTKKWWTESGEYDPGMLEWGGENLEQSIRVWLCGGEVFVVRNSFVGHIFDRPPKPNPEGKLVKQVQTNQKRTALVWLDDYYRFFEEFHPIVKTLDEGPGLEERYALRQKLRCKPFQWYVDKFRTAFERKGLLVEHFHHIRHVRSRWCLSKAEGKKVVLAPCRDADHKQQWSTVSGNRMMYVRDGLECLDGSDHRRRFLSQKSGTDAVVAPCLWNEIFKAENNAQFWQFDAIKSHRIFNYETKDYKTLTGNDYFKIDSSKAFLKTSMCLSASPSFWEMSQKSYEPSKMVEDVTFEKCHEDAQRGGDWQDPQAWEWIW